ncbi:HAD-IIB family hydrolase [[Acholeplasma] multilocale]|uniref:HAD-IIB family hydrolase n=1 Tax=[Acholeplasma] multilocale TaxID=264638 RepID=UPI00047EA08D|nr:HAD-IIB family hydrolase [[Acholeplasma] multilocale]
MTKWLFTDFDGTLRNSKGEELRITPKDLDFVKKWQVDGNKLIIATGRPYEHISEHVNGVYDLYPDFYVTNAGGTVVDGEGKNIYTNTMTEEEKLKIMNFLIEIEDEIQGIVYSTPGDENFLFHKDWENADQEMFMGMTPQNLPINYVEDKTMICYKVLSTDETWNKITKFLDDNNLNMNLTSNNLRGIKFSEIHHNNVNKGSAIRGLQSILGFKDEDVIVAGDDNNDLSMFAEFFENSYIVTQPYNEDIRNKAETIISELNEVVL